MTKKESEIKVVAAPVERVYARLGDLRNFQTLKERINDPQVQQMIGDKVPADKMQQLVSVMEKMEFTADSIIVDSPMGGQITLSIIERVENKLLKFGAEGSPIPVNLWIQMLPADAYSARIKVTVGADVNLFMKAMIGKPLQQAADGVAQMLAAIPY